MSFRRNPPRAGKNIHFSGTTRNDFPPRSDRLTNGISMNDAPDIFIEKL